MEQKHFLTGNKDIDIYIILSLSFADVNRICKTSQYAYNLCHESIELKQKMINTQKRVSRIIDIIKTRSYLILNFNDEYQNYDFIINIAKHIGINFENYRDQIPGILDIAKYKHDSYYILYQTNFSEHQFILFLTHLYYDNLILII